MSLLPKSHEEFSHKDFWNSFFKKRGTRAFEWYGEYPELSGLLHKYIKPKDIILMIGCGNSSLSADLYDVGYRHLTNIDISYVVIRQMIETHGKDRPDMVYQQMDALHMTFDDNEFSVVLDKGTLDALMPDNSEEVQKRIDKLFSEIDRVLRMGGRYVCVSLLQEHILLKLLEYFPAAGWMFRVCRCIEAERKSPDGDGPAFPVFVVICTKFKKLANATPVLEVCFTCEQIQRVKTQSDVVIAVRSVQQSAMVCARLSRGTVAGHGEVSLDLHRPNEDTPRYTVYVLDQPYSRETSRRFAAFIVPQGRETEWLFATPEGRVALLKSAGFDRLAVVALHRDHTYKGLDAVQEELCDSILHLAPPGCRQGNQIPFLSVGSDVGRREVCYRGHSQMSGDFVVEEAEGDGGKLFRRLIFLNNQGTVQSEARLKILKSRKGKPKKVVDIGYLASDYLIYMTVGVALAAPENSVCHVAVIGLRGGGLCSFIQHCFTKIRITAVDIDPVMLEIATNYFGLVQDERLGVYIRDGIQYIQQAAEKGTTFDVVLFDVDSKNHTLVMSCPPKEFLEPDVLQAVKTCIGETGFFVLNLVCPNVDLRMQALKNLTAVFDSVSSFKLEQEVSEIVFCCGFKVVTGDEWRSLIEAAAVKVNALAKKRKLQTDNLVDVTNLVSSLQIST
ncbi:eEF1A lysine and N-terminal methyltransferase homolog [Schistocerca gregaria]|uniref:eEF1A lysine and N-terminal methyltransferase homolog n=1 Tax=Schistocerca gregaria TaxID=7010 RepID=UPI00211E3E19|nr:eEF1A lysine and N-terminal methyltransferase homolog [Schistocerca gregaria]